MHVQTHLMSGWCLANLLPMTPRQRLFCMIAATAPDLDGLGILISHWHFEEYHHVLGHNLTFSLLGAAILAGFSVRRRILAFLVYLAMFHLHLVMDYYGSGPGWGISYWYPWARGREDVWINHQAWEFYSWQNLSAAAVFLAWTLAILWIRRRTPLEALMPKLDRQLVQVITRHKVANDPASPKTDKFPAPD